MSLRALVDVREPPFSELDGSWLNGNNSQPASLLTVGPLTWTVYVDTYYAYQIRHTNLVLDTTSVRGCGR
jgi:hypothetical protein